MRFTVCGYYSVVAETIRNSTRSCSFTLPKRKNVFVHKFQTKVGNIA